jgi:phosphate:Na+ symporter
MGANIGTTVTGLLVALKNDIFNMLMYLLAFAGVMMGFVKNEKVRVAGSLCSGLGLIFVGLNVMSSEQAFGNPLVEELFTGVFARIDFPLLLILVGVIFTALIQSSSAATGVVITMVGTGVLPLELALFIVLGANIGTCVTALLASVGANANSKRVALIHFTFNVIGTVLFTALIWIFKEPAVDLLVSLFPGSDPMSLQMRVSVFHVVFNVTTTAILLPFTGYLVKASCLLIKDKTKEEESLTLRSVDERLLSTPPVALMQVKKEMDYMLSLVEENMNLSFAAMQTGDVTAGERMRANEAIVDFTNGALTQFLIKLSSTSASPSDERVVGSYFHVLNDLERIGDHAENFFEIAEEMQAKGIAFSERGRSDMSAMQETVLEMLALAKDAFENLNREALPRLSELEETADVMKKELTAGHFARLAEGLCSVAVSPYFASAVSGLERVSDHLVNVGFSIVNPIGSQREIWSAE